MTKNDFKTVLVEVLNEGRGVTEEVHRVHHKFIDTEIKRRESNKLRMEKFRMSFIGAVAIGMASGLAWIGKLVVDSFGRVN